MSYYLNQDYVNYPFTNNGNYTSASQFVKLMLVLDHDVFGHDEFIINDKRLFDFNIKYPTQLNVKIKLVQDAIQSPTNNAVGDMYCYLIKTQEAANGKCTCGPSAGGCWCWRIGCCATRECIMSTETYEPPAWPNGPNPTNPTGTGGGSGNNVPHQFPCIPNNAFTGTGDNNVLPGGPLPTCPAPTGGPGWIPAPTPTPCDKIIPLKNSALFKAKFAELKLKTSLNYESSFSFTNTNDAQGYFFASGQGGPRGEVTIPSLETASIAGSAHTHYSGMLSIFSVGDLQAVYEMMILNRAFPYSYTYSLTTSQGNSYVITINDYAKFLAFGNKYFNNNDENAKLEKFYRAYRIGEFPVDPTNPNNNTKNEAAFLEMLADKDAGLTVLRPSQNLNNYSVLQRQSATSVLEIPCN
jgi:hypothetical protein